MEFDSHWGRAKPEERDRDLHTTAFDDVSGDRRLGARGGPESLAQDARNCRRRRRGLFLVSWPPVDWLLSRPLEARYAIRPFAASSGPQALVVFSERVEPPHFERPYSLASENTYERCLYTACIYRRCGPLPVLVSGGSAAAGFPARSDDERHSPQEWHCGEYGVDRGAVAVHTRECALWRRDSALAAILLMACFSTEVAESDTWLHLETGKYVVEHHQIPRPDPFGFTTYLGKPGPGEETVRAFDLTHSWLGKPSSTWPTPPADSAAWCRCAPGYDRLLRLGGARDLSPF